MNVVLMMNEILRIANPVIRESALPDFAFAPEHFTEGVGVSTFDELNRMFDGDVPCWSE